MTDEIASSAIAAQPAARTRSPPAQQFMSLGRGACYYAPASEGDRDAKAIQADVGGWAPGGGARALGSPGAGPIPRPGAAHRASAGWRRRAADRRPAAARSQFSRSARWALRRNLAALWPQG